MERVLIVDGGSCTVKIGLGSSPSPVMLQNRVWQSKSDHTIVVAGTEPKEADGNDSTTNSRFMSYSPTSSGCVVDWDTEALVWNAFFKDDSFCGGSSDHKAPEAKKAKLFLPKSFEEISLLCTEPALCPDTLRRAAYQTYFETMKFASVHVALAETLALREFFKKRPEAQRTRHTAVVVDVGHAATRVVPYIVGKSVLRPVTRGIRRIEVGGEALTAAYAHETHIPEHSSASAAAAATTTAACREKETHGYVALDFAGELARKDSVTADFRVPEALFNPSDIGVNQCGVADAVAQAVDAVKLLDPKGTCVLVRGGSSRFRNFAERLSTDLRALFPEDYSFEVFRSDE